MFKAASNSNIVIALVIVFICLLSAGLIVYAVFFTINKVYFKKLIKISKKYNEVLNGLYGINIYKIQVLAKNDIGNKFELNNYISIYKKLKANLDPIKANIGVAEMELNAFNLKVANKYISSIDADLNKALADLKELKAGYDSYTSYGHTIQITFQNYLEIYEKLWDFYQTRLPYSQEFTTINKLFVSIATTFESIPLMANEFDYKKTINSIIDLSSKLKNLAKAVKMVYRFQIVDTYLKTTKEYTDKIISNHYQEIAGSDLQTLQNLLTVFTHAYKRFNTDYRNLKLDSAKKYAINAINAIAQVNQFTYVHLNTPTWINISVNEIKEQTDRIIANKNDILNSLSDLKQYFVLEPKIIETFDLIEKDINYISVLNNAASGVNAKTHTEKIRAVKDLDNIGKQIVGRKTEIIESIDAINDILAKVIKTVTDLNDLYIYFWQLQSIIKQVAPDDEDSKDMISLIQSNLKQIEKYSKLIITEEQPDFDNIAYELTSIVEESNQIYQRMTTAVVLKTYANKLFTYANRYKKFPELKKDFAQATKLFKAKKYDDCIDTLLQIIKSSKKHKQ